VSAEVPVWRWGDSPRPLIEALERGAILALPTESSYGLGVDPRSAVGVEAIFRLKGRDAGKPLPVVVAGIDQIRDLGGDVELLAASGLAAAWPAPLTVVLPLACPLPAAAGSPGLGFRVPAHAPLRSLLSELGRGVTATSANRSGEPALLDPRPVARLLRGEDAVLVDGGVLPGGSPSTVVAARPDGVEVLRPGSYPIGAPAEGGFPTAAIGAEPDA
jgi:L-threonylcarbamoyladenylate synthase